LKRRSFTVVLAAGDKSKSHLPGERSERVKEAQGTPFALTLLRRDDIKG